MISPQTKSFLLVFGLVVILVAVAVILWWFISRYTGPVYTVVETGKFVVFNTDVCVELPTCFGQNPDSPYGRLIFPITTKDLSNYQSELDLAEGLLGAFHLQTNQAVIVRGITPPMAKYFGFTLYLFSESDGFVPFASLGDTINNLDLPFNSPFSIIITGSINIAERLQRFQKTIYPDEICLILPVPMADYVSPEDTLLVVLRTAFFNADLAGEAYLSNVPITGQLINARIKPGTLYSRQPLIPREPGIDEYVYESEYVNYINTEIEQISKSPNVAQILQEIPFYPYLEGIGYDSGYDCIEHKVNCLGDNRDTSYIITEPITLGPNQTIIVMGVNHVETGNAVYVSQSLYDTDVEFGITSFSDNDLAPGSMFYTFSFGRAKVEGLDFPQYVIADPNVQHVTLAERAYIQPGSHVGPEASTLLWPKAFLVQLNS